MKYKTICMDNGLIYACGHKAETATEKVNYYDEMIFELSEKNDKLKQQNKEMLDCLKNSIKLQKKYYGNATDLHVEMSGFATYATAIIEKQTGKPIEEVMKMNQDEINKLLDDMPDLPKSAIDDLRKDVKKYDRMLKRKNFVSKHYNKIFALILFSGIVIGNIILYIISEGVLK